MKIWAIALNTFREAVRDKILYALLFFALLMILGSLALQIPTMLSGDPNSLLSLVYSIVVGWFATMIGISLLTTVYGHCVEGRGVD